MFEISFGLLLIFTLRLLIPLTIFRWPLWGGVASLIIDALDTNIVKPFGVEIPNYTLTDKYLDTYYLTIELVVSFKWLNKLARNTSIFLYVWRLLGVAAYQFTYNEIWFVIAPNLFENFFLFVTFLQTRKKESWLSNWKRLLVVLFLLWLPKIPQELVLHVWRVGSPVETIFSKIAGLFN